MSSTVNEILSALKQIDETTSFYVYIPSLNREIKFKQLNTQQFKHILKTVIDSPIHNTQFIITFNSIIKENCLDQIDIEKLTILDKLLIFYIMRVESLSLEYSFDIGKVNLKDRYNEIKKDIKHIEPQSFNYNNYSITCCLPTLATENKIEKELYKNIQVNIESPEEFRAVLGDTFINEITKFISELKIGDNAIDLETLDFKSRIKIVEQLPTIIMNDVLKYIETYRNLVNKITIVSFPQTDTKTIQRELPLDATFFNI